MKFDELSAKRKRSSLNVNLLKKEVGDYVELDEIVCSVETDKTQVPIRSPEAGVITELFAADGDSVQVGKPFFVIDTEGKKAEGAVSKTAAKTEAVSTAKSSAPKSDQKGAPPTSAGATAAKKTDTNTGKTSGKEPTQIEICKIIELS